jgi:hypothetical protein
VATIEEQDRGDHGGDLTGADSGAVVGSDKRHDTGFL